MQIFQTDKNTESLRELLLFLLPLTGRKILHINYANTEVLIHDSSVEEGEYFSWRGSMLVRIEYVYCLLPKVENSFTLTMLISDLHTKIFKRLTSTLKNSNLRLIITGCIINNDYWLRPTKHLIHEGATQYLVDETIVDDGAANLLKKLV